jgi:ParB family chromosome partitioning protein
MSKHEKFKTLAHQAFVLTPSEDRQESATMLAESPASRKLQGTERLGSVRLIPIERIVTDSQQPRRTFSEKSLNDLAASVRSYGIIQPLTVEYDSVQDVYKIVTGERRYRAAKLAGLKQVPCIISENLSPEDRLYYQLIENVQRQDITPFDEADAFKRLSDQFAMTHEAIARMVGKSRPYVTKMLGLIRIPTSVRRRCKAHGVDAREQLMLLAQQKTEQSMLALLDAMDQTGKDVRTVRRLVKPSRATHPKPYVFRQRGYTVKVSFNKQKPSKQDIVHALRDALNYLEKR